MSRALLAALVMLVTLLASVTGFAQSADLQASVDTDTIGVGDTVQYTLRATTGGDVPNDAKPGPIPGFHVVGSPSVSQTASFSIVINGVQQRGQRTVQITWTLEAERVGTFTLGPPSVAVAGQRVTARAVTVHVVPAGAAPPRRHAQQQDDLNFSPFDIWKNRPPGFPGFDTEPTEPTGTPDPKLALDAPRGAHVFLHAFVDKSAAVVGEDVTVSIYIYTEQRGLTVNIGDEIVANDFSKRLIDDGSKAPNKFANVGGTVYNAQLLRKWLIFPLRAGDLETGTMSIAFADRGGRRVARDSESIPVHVTEPPVQGRPPGYVLGDVGVFALKGDVTPRTIDRDGALAVNLELSGQGNLPPAIKPPERQGVEWLDPETHEKIDVVSDRLVGRRTFDYVVRVHREGDVDLGEVEVPYWDPGAKRYDVAKAALGSVHVNPGATPPSPADSAAEMLPDLPKPAALTGDGAKDTLASREHLADRPVFWAGLGVSPALFAAFAGLRAAARGMRRRRAERAESPAVELRQRIQRAEAACKNGDARAADAAIAHALEHATLARVGVNVRDAIGEARAERLQAAGVSRETSELVQTLLVECEASRFAPPDGGAAGDLAKVRDRWSRARKAIDALKAT